MLPVSRGEIVEGKQRLTVPGQAIGGRSGIRRRFLGKQFEAVNRVSEPKPTATEQISLLILDEFQHIRGVFPITVTFAVVRVWLLR